MKAPARTGAFHANLLPHIPHIKKILTGNETNLYNNCIISRKLNLKKMKLKNIVSTEKFGNLKAISDYNTGYLAEMVNAMLVANNEQNQQPSLFYSTWVKNSEYKNIEYSLLNDYSIEIIKGNKVRRLLLSSLLSFKITDYIKNTYRKKINFKESKLLDYNTDIYRTLTAISIAMLLNKYRPNSLYKEHIVFVCIQVMLTYFTLFRNNSFLVKLDDAFIVTKEILETDISVFEELADNLGFKSFHTGSSKIPRTLTKEQIEEFICPEDTQTEIKMKIMRWCPCGERKARSIMQEHGLTKQKYARNAFKNNSEEESETEIHKEPE